MAQYVIARVKEDNNNSLSGKKVQLIGVAYKPNVADVRETPAAELWKLLEKEGAIISWHDPLVKEWNSSKNSELGAEISIVVTLHEILDINALKKKSKYIFDTTGNIPDVKQL
jgi:UDP-N-acetyl-D-glucosamine dehydrogenase